MLTILKGIGLGTLMIFVFTFAYFWANGMVGSGGAVGVGVARGLTIGNSLYWVAAGLMLALGVVIALMWPGKVIG